MGIINHTDHRGTETLRNQGPTFATAHIGVQGFPITAIVNAAKSFLGRYRLFSPLWRWLELFPLPSSSYAGSSPHSNTSPE